MKLRQFVIHQRSHIHVCYLMRRRPGQIFDYMPSYCVCLINPSNKTSPEPMCRDLVQNASVALLPSAMNIFLSSWRWIESRRSARWIEDRRRELRAARESSWWRWKAAWEAWRRSFKPIRLWHVCIWEQSGLTASSGARETRSSWETGKTGRETASDASSRTLARC